MPIFDPQFPGRTGLLAMLEADKALREKYAQEGAVTGGLTPEEIDPNYVPPPPEAMSMEALAAPAAPVNPQLPPPVAPELAGAPMAPQAVPATQQIGAPGTGMPLPAPPLTPEEEQAELERQNQLYQQSLFEKAVVSGMAPSEINAETKIGAGGRQMQVGHQMMTEGIMAGAETAGERTRLQGELALEEQKKLGQVTQFEVEQARQNQQAVENAQKTVADLTESYKRDPGLFADKTTGQKIAGMLSLFIGGFLAPMQGGRNVALEMMNKFIDNDLAKKADIFHKQLQQANISLEKKQEAADKYTIAVKAQKMAALSKVQEDLIRQINDVNVTEVKRVQAMKLLGELNRDMGLLNHNTGLDLAKLQMAQMKASAGGGGGGAKPDTEAWAKQGGDIWSVAANAFVPRSTYVLGEHKNAILVNMDWEDESGGKQRDLLLPMSDTAKVVPGSQKTTHNVIDLTNQLIAEISAVPMSERVSMEYFETEAGARIKSLFTSLEMALKESQELGALNASERVLLHDQVGSDPTSWMRFMRHPEQSLAAVRDTAISQHRRTLEATGFRGTWQPRIKPYTASSGGKGAEGKFTDLPDSVTTLKARFEAPEGSPQRAPAEIAADFNNIIKLAGKASDANTLKQVGEIRQAVKALPRNEQKVLVPGKGGKGAMKEVDMLLELSKAEYELSERVKASEKKLKEAATNPVPAKKPEKPKVNTATSTESQMRGRLQK